MGFRRHPQSVLTERKWRQFITDNASLAQAIGLPQAIMDSEDYWVDTIVYGYAESAWNPADAFSNTLPDFNASELKSSQYEIFLLLVERYFEAGFPFLKPSALQPQDMERLTRQFA